MATAKSTEQSTDLKKYKPLIRVGFEYPGEGLKLFSLLTLKKYRTWLNWTSPSKFENLRFYFLKQASTVVASNFHESYSTLHLFRLFATFSLLGYISEITRPICETDTIILVSVIFHDAIFTTINIMRLTLFEPN